MREDARWMRWLLVSAAVIVLDLATKAWVMRALHAGDVLVLTSWFNLVLAYNEGAAFSFLAHAGGWQRWFFLALSVVISAAILVMLRRHERQRLTAFALALVLGGALGNAWDRVAIGHVVDFVQLHAAGYYWPAFNVADSAISVGVVLLLLENLGRSRAARSIDNEPPSREKA
ncbi:MAG TPA: signal peptidase II [Usitatibacter sp.]|jgi:signal peptidase II|nr:signal peptidase II [Usitatibacter sp.]